jgi:endonuclease III
MGFGEPMAQVVDTTIERNVGVKFLCVYYAVDTHIHRVVNVESYCLQINAVP